MTKRHSFPISKKRTCDVDVLLLMRSIAFSRGNFLATHSVEIVVQLESSCAVQCVVEQPAETKNKRTNYHSAS